MKAFEAAKKLGMKPKEFCEEYGVKSHLSKITEELEAELFGGEKKIETEQETTETVDSAETVVLGGEDDNKINADEVEVQETDNANKPVEKAPEEVCPVDLETLKLSLRGCGGKSPYYKWKYLLNG
jgi:hypothetical protein